MFRERLERWAFGNGPGNKYAIVFETEVVVEAGRVVPLDVEVGKVCGFFLGYRFGGRFRGFLEIAFAAVFLDAIFLD